VVDLGNEKNMIDFLSPEDNKKLKELLISVRESGAELPERDETKTIEQCLTVKLLSPFNQEATITPIQSGLLINHVAIKREALTKWEKETSFRVSWSSSTQKLITDFEIGPLDLLKQYGI
jgi:hypothetical protein